MTSGNNPQDRIGSLYRATRQESPPPHLDRAILTAARSAARRRRLRWIVPASSAALVLLGLSLSYRFLEDLAQLEAPEALAPALLEEERAPAQTGDRAARRPPDSVPKPAPPPEESDGIRQPAKAPSPGATLGLSSEPETRRAPPATPKAQLRRVPEPAMSQPMEAEEESPVRSADKWLRQIRAYKDAGDLEAARDLLREFLRQFPDAETPQDLRDLMAMP